MSVLELKGELHELIASIQNEQLLQSLKIAIQKVANIETESVGDYALSPEQEEELMISLKESYDEANMISFEESKKNSTRWLK